MGDVHEREADRIADRVMQGDRPAALATTSIDPRVQRVCSECEDEREEIVQRKPHAASGSAGQSPASSLFERGLAAARASGGHPLHTATRQFMQPQMRTDLNTVRIHADARANELSGQVGARAFTVGKDVFFRHGEYQPETRAGMRLIAHELAHTMQQSGGTTVRRQIAVTNEERPGEEKKVTTDSAVFVPLVYAAPDPDLKTVQLLLSDFIHEPSKLLGVPERTKLVNVVYAELKRSPVPYEFVSYRELADEIMSRVMIVLLMNRSQGKTAGFDYPDRGATAGLPPQANAAARKYWQKQEGYGGKQSVEYQIDLTPAGKNDAYSALETLFASQANPRKRTLVHCDHMIGIIDLFTLARKVGRDKFNDLVRAGTLEVRIHRAAHDEVFIHQPSELMRERQVRRHNVITRVKVASTAEFMPGDHVVFYNHPAYSSLNLVTRRPWKLENAIVVARDTAGELLYQGHGFKAGVRADVMRRAMADHFNTLVDEARALIRAGQFTDLKDKFPSVLATDPRNKDISQWKIYFEQCPDEQTTDATSDQPKPPAYGSMPLVRLDPNKDYENPFIAPCEDVIWVYRPLESAAYLDFPQTHVNKESDDKRRERR